MRIYVVVASVPVWIVDVLRDVADDRPWAYALGFGLDVMLGVSPAARRQLADVMAPKPDDERRDVEVRIGWVALDGLDDEDMSLAEIVEAAAAIVATVRLDPAARADFELVLKGEGGRT